MTYSDIITTINHIVNKARKLNHKFTNAEDLPIDYVCIFTQSQKEFDELNNIAEQMGDTVQDTPTGPVYGLNLKLETQAGELPLLKIRKPDPARPQKGDADFNTNYLEFKKEHLEKESFNLIDRGDYEMLELKVPESDVLVYFSSRPLSKDLGIT